ncbi:hypothetical protein Bca52824_001632 [Brassica carinata]|uniref:Uncharacterized protein n=1 Tax=Brassica carinata TaxID=52824 RepID=A0A8X7WJF0_BRACI|nr:hypothetical protein Bca52824_001632 [Brassica carinata]
MDSKIGYRTRELELTILENYASNFTDRGKSYVRYDERGKGMADGGSVVSSIEGVHDSYIVVIYWPMDYVRHCWNLLSPRCHIGLVNTDLVLLVKEALFKFPTTRISSCLPRRKVDKYINVFVTFKENSWKMNFLRPMGNLLKFKEVSSSSNMQVGNASLMCTRNEVNAGEDSALEEAEDGGDEDYDFNLWHDFVGRNCEWDDDKDEDGGVGGGARTNVTYGGVRGEVATKARSGRTNPSSNKGSGSSTNKQRTANPPSTFEDYVDEGRFYIGSSRAMVCTSDMTALPPSRKSWIA